ncbi:MAG TPA: hypothetical protein VHY80_01610 [Stellaceae bacterium]|nr:hypothetical protein [Stellaceae bacterium]
MSLTRTFLAVLTIVTFSLSIDARAEPGKLAWARGIEAAHAQGFVSAAIDPHQYVDLSMIEEAAWQLH